MNLITFTSRTAAATVAAVAGFSSYRHIFDVAIGAGEHHAVAVALPLSIDGLIVVGTMALLEDKRAGRLPRQSARYALGFGVLATLAANIASAEPTWTARAVAAVPAVSFLIAVEVLARTGKSRAEFSAPAEVNDSAHLPASAKIEPANAEVTPRSNRQHVNDLPPQDHSHANDLDPRESAREVYRASVAEGVPLSGAELARRFGKSARWGVERVAEVRRNGTRDLAEVKS